MATLEEIIKNDKLENYLLIYKLQQNGILILIVSLFIFLKTMGLLLIFLVHKICARIQLCYGILTCNSVECEYKLEMY